MSGKQALVIIDLQIGLNDGQELYQLPEVIATINQRITDYRSHELPIIVIQHCDEDLRVGTREWQVFPELQIAASDNFVRKTHANSFYHTNLQEVLAGLDVSTLEFCGAQTEYCVDTTVRFAHGLGYRSFMSKGANTTIDNDRLKAEQIIAHHEAIWANRFLTFITEEERPF